MTTRIEEQDDKFVVTLVGALDTSSALEMNEALVPLFIGKGKDILLDCSKLDYISSTGLRVFLNVLKSAQTSGRQVILKNVNDVVMDVLKMTGFVSYFEFE